MHDSDSTAETQESMLPPATRQKRPPPSAAGGEDPSRTLLLNRPSCPSVGTSRDRAMFPLVSKQEAASRTSPMTSMPRGSTWRPPAVTMSDLASGGNPPVTITGVAPWAFQQTATATRTTTTASSPLDHKERIPLSTARPNRLPRGEVSTSHHHQGINESASLPLTPVDGSSTKNSLEVLLNYIEKCRLNGQGGAPDDDGKGSSWAREQAALKPTLLPDLKFHDLVFGQSVPRAPSSLP
jgi:hypothetical protein